MHEKTKTIIKIKLNTETLNTLTKLADFVGVPLNEFIADMLVAYFKIMNLLTSQKNIKADTN